MSKQYTIPEIKAMLAWTTDTEETLATRADKHAFEEAAPRIVRELLEENKRLNGVIADMERRSNKEMVYLKRVRGIRRD